jgi:hypothetical protein
MIPRYTVDIFFPEDILPENIIWKEPIENTSQFVRSRAFVAKHERKDGWFYVIRAHSLVVPKWGTP